MTLDLLNLKRNNNSIPNYSKLIKIRTMLTEMFVTNHFVTKRKPVGVSLEMGKFPVHATEYSISKHMNSIIIDIKHLTCFL